MEKKEFSRKIKVFGPFREIEDFINVMEYDLYTKDIHLCITIRRDENNMWRGTLYLMRFPEGDNICMRETESPLPLKECLSYFNEWIKNNFKTSFDKEISVSQEILV